MLSSESHSGEARQVSVEVLANDCRKLNTLGAERADAKRRRGLGDTTNEKHEPREQRTQSARPPMTYKNPSEFGLLQMTDWSCGWNPLVGTRKRGAVDDEVFDWATSGLQLQSQLLLERRHQ